MTDSDDEAEEVSKEGGDMDDDHTEDVVETKISENFTVLTKASEDDNVINTVTQAINGPDNVFEKDESEEPVEEDKSEGTSEDDTIEEDESEELDEEDSVEEDVAVNDDVTQSAFLDRLLDSTSTPGEPHTVRQVQFPNGTAVITRSSVLIGGQRNASRNNASFSLLPEQTGRGLILTRRIAEPNGPARRILLNLRNPSERVGVQQYKTIMKTLRPFFEITPHVTRAHAELCRQSLEQSVETAQAQVLLHYLTDASVRDAFAALLGDRWRQLAFERKDILYSETMGGEFTRAEWQRTEPILRERLTSFVSLLQQAPTLAHETTVFFMLTDRDAPVLTDTTKTWWSLERGDQVRVRTLLDTSTNLSATLKYAQQPLDWHGATIVALQLPAQTHTLAVQDSEVNNVRFLLAPDHKLTIESRLQYAYGQPKVKRHILFARLTA